MEVKIDLNHKLFSKNFAHDNFYSDFLKPILWFSNSKPEKFTCDMIYQDIVIDPEHLNTHVDQIILYNFVWYERIIPLDMNIFQLKRSLQR